MEYCNFNTATVFQKQERGMKLQHLIFIFYNPRQWGVTKQTIPSKTGRWNIVISIRFTNLRSKTSLGWRFTTSQKHTQIVVNQGGCGMKLQHPTSATINQQVEVKSTKGKKISYMAEH
jgi:hypothetical protein